MNKNTSINTRYPADVLEQMKKLALAHGRSFNGEVIWALREYIKKGKSTMYEIQYEVLTTDQETIRDTMSVEAVSPERAVEHATNILEERYEGGTLLECSLM